MTDPMSPEELQACRKRAEGMPTMPAGDALRFSERCIPRLLATIAAIQARAESAELGCDIAYRREPTQAEGDAHEYRHEQSMGPAHGSGECFVSMGGWTGRRCRICSRWVWGGPTACVSCVAIAQRDEQIARLKDALVAKATGARAAAHASDSAACELDDIATTREMACATRIFGHDHPEFHDLSHAEWVAELLNAYEKEVRK